MSKYNYFMWCLYRINSYNVICTETDLEHAQYAPHVSRHHSNGVQSSVSRWDWNGYTYDTTHQVIYTFKVLHCILFPSYRFVEYLKSSYLQKKACFVAVQEYSWTMRKGGS